MTTAFRTIAVALAASLTGAMAGVPVFQNRLKPLPEDQAQAVVVRTERTTGQEIVLGMTDWQTEYTVECYGRGITSADPSAAVDELVQAVWSRLSTVDLTAFQVMSVTLNANINWDYGEAETPFACAVLALQIVHRTPADSLA